MMALLLIVAAVLLVVGIVKISVKVLKLVFTLCLIGVVVTLLSSMGILPW